MTPALRLIYEKQKLNEHDRYLAEALPLLRKRLMLEGKANNAEIDNIFEQLYRLNAIGSMHKSQPLLDAYLAANRALVAACDIACDQRKPTIAPSTDQKRDIGRALDALAALARSMTNKTYVMACVYASEAIQANRKIAA